MISLSAKKSQEQRFGELVAKIGISEAQRQLDIFKGYMYGASDKAEPTKLKRATRAAAAAATKTGDQ